MYREQRCGQDWLGPEFGLAPRAVSRILRRHLPYLRDCGPRTAAVIRASETTAVRYECDRPGDGALSINNVGTMAPNGYSPGIALAPLFAVTGVLGGHLWRRSNRRMSCQ